MQNKNQRITNNPLKKLNIDYFLTYPLVFIILGIFLLPKLAFLSSITEENIIKLTNEERLSLSIPTLTKNELLTKAAYAKGKSIIESQTFQHNIGDKKFSTWIKDVNYKYVYIGENLALDFTTSEGATKAWLNSPSHKKNLLNEKFKEIGVAVMEGDFQGKSTTLIVQIFGTPIVSANNETLTKGSESNKTSTQAEENKNINIKPVEYQPNLFESSMDVIYNKKISAIVLLNFITIIFLTTFFTIHRIINFNKKSIKCTK